MSTPGNGCDRYYFRERASKMRLTSSFVRKRSWQLVIALVAVSFVAWLVAERTGFWLGVPHEHPSELVGTWTPIGKSYHEEFTLREDGIGFFGQNRGLHSTIQWGATGNVYAEKFLGMDSWVMRQYHFILSKDDQLLTLRSLSGTPRIALEFKRFR